MPEALSTTIVIVGFLVGFPLFWLAVVFLISRLTGWAGLAQRFAVSPEKKVAGDSFGWSSVQFNVLGSYSNCIDIVVSREGIYMRPVWPFRFGHEPLLVPWRDVEDIISRDRWLFTVHKAVIRPQTHGGWPTTLTFLGKRLGESLARYQGKTTGN